MTHLTEEQLYDLLDNAANAPQHLDSCAQCQDEFANLRATLANFRDATTSLAAAELPALTQRKLVPAAPVSIFRRPVFAASFATVAAMAAISISLLHPGRPANQPAAPAANQPAIVAENTVDDDALLDGIQTDLSTSIPPSLQPLDVPAASSATPNSK